MTVLGADLYNPGVYRVDEIDGHGIGSLEWYPNRDSTAYVEIEKVSPQKNIFL